MWVGLWARLGKWLALAGGVVLAAAGLFAWGFRKGARHQAGADAEQRAADAAQAMQETRDTWSDATQAADQVQQHAQQQSPPDTTERDDFNNTF